VVSQSARITPRLDLAIHLRHRVSFDLDYMAVGSFSGDHLARTLKRAVGNIDVFQRGSDQLKARVLGVQVQVFKTPYRGWPDPRLKADRPPEACGQSVQACVFA